MLLVLNDSKTSNTLVYVCRVLEALFSILILAVWAPTQQRRGKQQHNGSLDTEYCLCLKCAIRTHPEARDNKTQQS